MRIDSDMNAVDGLPILYIRSLNMLVAADLHLGYEGIMSDNGVFLPKANLKSILSSIDKAIMATGAKTLLVDGDIKNEFSKVHIEEFNELYDFILHMNEKGVDLLLIKGNHDNFVERYKDAFKLKVYRQEHVIGKYAFFHGEEIPQDIKGTSVLIMGHEHPAIILYTGTGKSEKIKCFLYGRYKGKRLLVLPALSYYSGGTSINTTPSSELLAPIFKNVDVDKMEAIAVGYGSTIAFGRIRELRKAAREES